MPKISAPIHQFVGSGITYNRHLGLLATIHSFITLEDWDGLFTVFSLRMAYENNDRCHLDGDVNQLSIKEVPGNKLVIRRRVDRTSQLKSDSY